LAINQAKIVAEIAAEISHYHDVEDCLEMTLLYVLDKFDTHNYVLCWSALFPVVHTFI